MNFNVSRSSLVFVVIFAGAVMGVTSAMQAPSKLGSDAALAQCVRLASVLEAPPHWRTLSAGSLSAGFTGLADPVGFERHGDDDLFDAPRVLLSAAHEKTCLVKVGDDFPPFALPDEMGQPQSLADVRGRKLSVVLVWSAMQPMAREQFMRIGSEVAEPFAERGVSVVAIHVGPLPDEIRELRPATDLDPASLCDAERVFFAKIATAKLPRTYLLDKNGKIVWMDIEYSRDMRRELDHAIRYYLGKS